MAKFKQVPQTFLFRQLMKYWGNMVQNFDADCRDDDFFDILVNCFDHDKAVALIETAYAPQELEEMQKARLRSNRLDLTDPLDDVFQALWNHTKTRGKCRIVLDSIREYMVADCEKDGEDAIEKRFRELKRVLKLSDLEAEVLMVAYVRSQTCFCWPCRVEDREKPLYYAMALDRSYAEITKVMSAKGKLRKFDILDNDWDFNCRMLGNFMDGTDSETIERRFYKKSENQDVLPWDFYGELAAKDGEIIRRLVTANRGKCNILLYGAPGTGKTSFARTLVRELGRTAYEVKQGDDDGKNMKAEARMMGIQICNGQEDPESSMMIVDEADELLRGSSCGYRMFGFDRGGTTEKGVMNSILDEMRLPAIWIVNASAGAIDESVRRRFDYSVCFERMNNAQRVSIWRNLVKKHHLGRLISDAKIDEYAVKYETSAGGISTVLSNVKQMKPSAGQVDELISTLMKPHCRLMEVEAGERFLPAKGYSLEGLNIKGKIKLENVVKAIRNYMDAGFNEASEDKPRMNLLLYGPPGTGKTEFVKYLDIWESTVADNLAFGLDAFLGPIFGPGGVAVVVIDIDAGDVDAGRLHDIGEDGAFGDEVADHDEATALGAEGAHERLAGPLGGSIDTGGVARKLVIVEVVADDVVGAVLTVAETTRGLPTPDSMERSAVLSSELADGPGTGFVLATEVVFVKLVVL